MTKTSYDHRPAILRALTLTERTKAALVAYLGAQDKWDAIDRDLQKLRRAGLVAYRHGARVWRVTEKGKAGS